MSGYGIDALSLFSGVDGWSQYDEELGIETTSLEKDDAAHATAVVAHKTNACQIDVTEYNLSPDHPYQLLEASPPCTKFTVAGNGEGRKLMEDILFRLEALRVHDTFITGSPFGRRVAGWKEASLVLEPARLIREAVQGRVSVRVDRDGADTRGTADLAGVRPLVGSTGLLGSHGRPEC